MLYLMILGRCSASLAIIVMAQLDEKPTCGAARQPVAGFPHRGADFLGLQAHLTGCGPRSPRARHRRLQSSQPLACSQSAPANRAECSWAGIKPHAQTLRNVGSNAAYRYPT